MRLVFPDQCLACRDFVDAHGALCPACRGAAWFFGPGGCDACGLPLPDALPGELARCDDCLTIARPWSRGRAVLAYRGTGRRLVLGLKHGDRLDLAMPLGRWMAAAGRDLWRPETILVPVPVHPLRRLRRRYNQAASLAHAVGRVAERPVASRALLRRRATPPQDGMGRAARFRNVADALVAHPRHGAAMAGRAVVLIDDVMTSGATLAAAADAATAAGAATVDVLILARVTAAP